MADKKISELPLVTTPAAADECVINQSGATSRITMANLMGYGNAGQPPAPKPNRTGSSGSYPVGRVLAGMVAGGNVIYYSGSTNESGTWLIETYSKDDATGEMIWESNGIEIGAGAWFSITAGRSAYYIARRIS